MDNIKQLTKEEAIELHDSGDWKQWTDEQIFCFQMAQDKLCVPFSRFHEAAEAALGRPVWTHEFAFSDKLKQEFLAGKMGIDARPSMEDIIALIPQHKLVFVVTE